MGCENSKAAEVQPHNPPSDLEVEDVKGAALSSPEEVVAKVSKAPKATKSTGKAAKAKVENKPAEAAEPAEAAATDLQVEVIANAAETEEAPPAQDAGGEQGS
jgi:cell pole-organizing protein PopZ